MFILRMILILSLTSCALFRGEKNLTNEDPLVLLDAVNINGEGRGRLTLKQNQYVFNFESGLQDNHDWILAVQIPLHGEEVMVLSDLKQSRSRQTHVESFEARIENDFKKLKLDKVLSTKEFVSELRSLVRFKMARELKLTPACRPYEEMLVCKLDNKDFYLKTFEKEFVVFRSLERGAMVVLSGSVLTNSFFEQTDIRLYTSKENYTQKKSDFSLELFWKN